MDRDSKHGEENCQLKEDRVYENAGCLIVQNSNQTLKYEQLRIRDSVKCKSNQMGTVETNFGSNGRGRDFFYIFLVYCSLTRMTAAVMMMRAVMKQEMERFMVLLHLAT